MSDEHIHLFGNTDAQAWAQSFVKTVREHPTIPEDEGTMIGWFANAIMAGYDAGQKAERERDFMDKLREIIYQVAGAATQPFMVAHPDMVMPSEEVTAGVEAVLRSFGIEPFDRDEILPLA